MMLLKTDNSLKLTSKPPRAILLGTKEDNQKSKEKWKSSSITNVTATNSMLDPSR
jgi:hypothetical protein